MTVKKTLCKKQLPFFEYKSESLQFYKQWSMAMFLTLSSMIFILMMLIYFLLYTLLPYDSSFASQIHGLRPHIMT